VKVRQVCHRGEKSQDKEREKNHQIRAEGQHHRRLASKNG